MNLYRNISFDPPSTRERNGLMIERLQNQKVGISQSLETEGQFVISIDDRKSFVLLKLI